MPIFAAILTYADKDKLQQVRPRHRAYLEQLLAQGKLLASGPWTDDSGALILYDAADEAEARALLAADPVSQTPSVLADVHLKEWSRVFASYIQ